MRFYVLILLIVSFAFIRIDAANVYFLIVTILQTIPSISITEGVPTQAIPVRQPL